VQSDFTIPNKICCIETRRSEELVGGVFDFDRSAVTTLITVIIAVVIKLLWSCFKPGSVAAVSQHGKFLASHSQLKVLLVVLNDDTIM